MSHGRCHSQAARARGDDCSVTDCDGQKTSNEVARLLHLEELFAQVQT